ncbi:hypothetical protein CI1B_68090 [Bradyrhizobium ivorense]|uniref:Uncharacterized protein n=2 Tax=Bradyrhizobium ivorense TaxID=2511166 RepID=A0A508TRA2_9BRAD|nr:hypothetical protein CI1B_68090 [Bradyrhizobium ivorense]
MNLRAFHAAGVFMTGPLRRRLPLGIRATLPAALALVTSLAAAPAHADPCEDIAKQLAGQIDGLKVNFTAANITYLKHPAAKELSIGCRGKDYSTELYAKTDRKMKPEFFNLVGSATALIFTVPKDDATTGTSRCLKRMGIFRGNTITMRYRRLNLECTRTRADASITVRRGKDE